MEGVCVCLCACVCVCEEGRVGEWMVEYDIQMDVHMILFFQQAVYWRKLLSYVFKLLFIVAKFCVLYFRMVTCVG